MIPVTCPHCKHSHDVDPNLFRSYLGRKGKGSAKTLTDAQRKAKADNMRKQSNAYWAAKRARFEDSQIIVNNTPAVSSDA